MNKLKTLALDKFNTNYECELKAIEETYRNSLKAYETAMKKFIIKHITSKSRFEECKRDAWLGAIDYGPAKDWVMDRDVYETMISNERWWLEEGQFDCEDEAEISNS